MTTDWPNQVYAVAEVKRLIASGERRLCICGPTGTGKSLIIQRLIEWCIELGRPAAAYVNRNFGLEQISEQLHEAGIRFGVRASGYEEGLEDVIIASIQTVDTRVGRLRMRLPDAWLVIVDEVHSEKADRVLRLLARHYDAGAIIVVLTATPIGIAHMADKMILAGTNSDGRKCGALVPALVYAPDEPDLRAFKSQRAATLQWKEAFKAKMLQRTFGRVIEHYHLLNQEKKPALLFAPGVPESRWFCDQFNAAGLPWSHIDGETIIINGREMPATRETRLMLRSASESGETLGISNRFVFREAANYPWLYHGILACTVGSVAAYVQMVGRLLRAHSSLDHVIIQDHGGNWWRHDSPNADREWRLDDTEQRLRERHESTMRSERKPDLVVCPKCKQVRNGGRLCRKCGHLSEGLRRTVIQTDGQLREVRGDIYKKRRVSTSPIGHKKWTACYFRCKKSGRTFNFARALFMRENGGSVPSPDFPLMPRFESDWGLAVKDVPLSRLTRGYERAKA